jgi:hypothetical protein
MEHGTMNAYANWRCRCDECRKAMREYARARRARARRAGRAVERDRDLVGDLLHELFPEGLTDDCPARLARHG